MIVNIIHPSSSFHVGVTSFPQLYRLPEDSRSPGDEGCQFAVIIFEVPDTVAISGIWDQKVSNHSGPYSTSLQGLGAFNLRSLASRLVVWEVREVAGDAFLLVELLRRQWPQLVVARLRSTCRFNRQYDGKSAGPRR